MTGKTHQTLGITIGVVSYLNYAPESYNPATFFAILIACYFASLLPDLDRPTAKIWSDLPLGHEVGHVVDPFFKHRNISHSILGVVIFACLAYFLFMKFPSYWGIDKYILLGVSVAAYFSHLLADMFTVEGVPLLFPVKKMFGIPPKPFEGVRIETGKWFENMVLFPIINLILVITLFMKWDLIKIILFK